MDREERMGITIATDTRKWMIVGPLEGGEAFVSSSSASQNACGLYMGDGENDDDAIAGTPTVAPGRLVVN